MNEVMLNTVDKIHIDILREIANIGSGNAITSLAEMLDKKIDMSVPNVKVVHFKDLAESLGGAENIILATLVAISGDISGMMMFIVTQNSAISLLESLGQCPENIKSLESVTKEQLQSINEVGKILTGSYLKSLTMLTGKHIEPFEPMFAIDMANAVLSVPAIEFGKMSDQILLIESVFGAGSDKQDVSGYFLLLPDMLSFKKIFQALEVM